MQNTTRDSPTASCDDLAAVIWLAIGQYGRWGSTAVQVLSEGRVVLVVDAEQLQLQLHPASAPIAMWYVTHLSGCCVVICRLCFVAIGRQRHHLNRFGPWTQVEASTHLIR